MDWGGDKDPLGWEGSPDGTLPARAGAVSAAE